MRGIHFKMSFPSTNQVFPTMTTIGFSAPRALTSTSTSWASTPRNAAENRRVIILTE